MSLRGLVIVAAVIIAVALIVSTCGKSCDTSQCKFKVGDDVHIKHKTFHDDATVVDVSCGCEYTINYYSYLGVRRHRVVTEGEIEKK